MRWALFAVTALGACSFTPGTLPGAARDDASGNSDDAASVTDASSNDAPPDADLSCSVKTMGSVQLGDYIGGTGGSVQADVTCPAGEFPIGMSFGMPPNPLSNHNNQLAVADLHVRCGRIERDPSGVMMTTPTSTISRIASNGSNCSSYFPRVPTGEVVCPAGNVLVGINGNSPDGTLYNTVALRCAALTPPSTISTNITVLQIAGSGSYSNDPQSAVCGAGTAVVTLGVRTGCGQDQLRLSCAAVVCN